MNPLAEPWQHTEQALLGGVLLDPAAFWKVAGIVDEADLDGEGHAEIWRCIRDLSQKGEKFDFIAVANTLGKRRFMAQIIDLQNNAPGSARVVSYAELVVANAEQRRINHAGVRISSLGPNQTNEAHRILSAATRPRGAAVQHMGAVMADWYRDVERRCNIEAEITGLSTGLPGLDAMTSGLQPGDLIVLAARPSMGKSALAGQIAYHAASTGHPALVFSLEMPSTQFCNRMVAAAANVRMSTLRTPAQMLDDDWSRITAVLGGMQQLPLHFDETPAISVDQLTAKARQLDAQTRLGLIVIDYLQIMQMRNPDNLTSSISEITAALKRLAKELQVPVLLLSQLSRKCDERADKRPMLSDLRESGSIEQDADICAFLYRDEVYHPDTHLKGIAELIFRKQRNGETGTVPLVAQLAFCRFGHCEAMPQEPAQRSDRPFSARFGRKAQP